MLNKEIQDKLVLVDAELQTRYNTRDNIYNNLAQVEARIKTLEDIKERLVQASASLDGIKE
jgi:hypothetical protein